MRRPVTLPPRSLAAAVGLLVLCSSCTVDRGLVGLPAHAGLDASRQTELLLEDLAAIESRIETRWSRADGDTADASHAAFQLHGMRAVLTAQVALSNEHIDYASPAQRIDPGRPPLVLHPRLIAPSIPEPVIVPAAGGGTRTCWFVPLLLRKDTLFWTRSTAFEWFGLGEPRIDYDDPGRYFGAFLVPHHERGGSSDDWIDLARYVVALEDVSVALPGGESCHLPHLVPDRRAVAFALPMRDGRGGDDDDGVAPGFYHLRMLPRLALGELHDEGFGPWRTQIASGDWRAALATLESRRRRTDAAAAAAMRADLAALARAIDEFPPGWFDQELDPLADRAREAATAGDLGASLRELAREMRSLLRSDPNPARVMLEAPTDPRRPFSFVVGADLQYSGDLTYVQQFLGMIDGTMLPQSGEDVGHALVTGPILDRLRQAKFVVVVGDLSDGAALSSTPGRAIGDALGLSPPSSPYLADFADLRREFERFGLPVFAVPGNHDGFANYGGVTNDLTAGIGSVLRWDAIPVPLRLVTRPVGTLLDRVAAVLPPLVKIGRIGSVPFSDGLVQWQHDLGPLHFAFRYRGHGFVGLNSYNLDVRYRDQIGALANNWGGGVDQNDAVWFDLMLRWLRPPVDDARRQQFVFMHHDPRAGRPFLRSFQEGDFGAYDAADALLNMLTFGYLGIGWSPRNPLWLPIITPLATNLPRQLRYGDAKFNQEWMMKDALFDEDMYGARQLVGAINENLAGPANRNGLSWIFFGHDDVPATSKWIHDDQAGYVFPAAPGQEWGASKWNALERWLSPFLRQRTSSPPEWARSMVFDDGRNARVMRCDDVGQSGSMHGFHLVTVDPGQPDDRQVTVEWIQIPR